MDELVKNGESEAVVEEIDSETPLYQFEESEQMYVYDPPKKLEIKKNHTSKAINYVNFILGISMFFVTLCILNKGFDFGFNFGFPYDFIAERFVRPYGGMNDIQVTSLAGALSLILFFSSLMYFSGRHTFAALLLIATVTLSISTRVILAYSNKT